MKTIKDKQRLKSLGKAGGIKKLRQVSVRNIVSRVRNIDSVETLGLRKVGTAVNGGRAALSILNVYWRGGGKVLRLAWKINPGRALISYGWKKSGLAAVHQANKNLKSFNKAQKLLAKQEQKTAKSLARKAAFNNSAPIQKIAGSKAASAVKTSKESVKMAAGRVKDQTKKILSKIGNSKVGKAGKVVGKGAKAAGKMASTAGKGILAPFRLLGKGFNAISAAIKKLVMTVSAVFF